MRGNDGIRANFELANSEAIFEGMIYGNGGIASGTI